LHGRWHHAEPTISMERRRLHRATQPSIEGLSSLFRSNCDAIRLKIASQRSGLCAQLLDSASRERVPVGIGFAPILQVGFDMGHKDSGKG
jgi:hypothetical protein